MRKFLFVIVSVLVSVTAGAQSRFSFGTASNPEGMKVEVDSKGIIMGEKHLLPVMGEIHYSRVPEAEWRREIRKMKAGGITVIATYVFWIHHEPIEGQWNWSGNHNLHKFLETCKEEGMPVVLRVGPFCHGEVYQGGFPEWVVANSQRDKSYKLRSEGKGFLAEVQRLYSNIYAQASDMLWKNGGPVIGVQIENECRGPWSYYMKLKDMAVSIGFDVPFYTRTGWPKLNGKEEFGKLLPLYGDYADGFWDRSLEDMPGEYPESFIMKDKRVSGVIATETFSKEELQGSDENNKSIVNSKSSNSKLSYPYLTCELGGGMMQAYHRRINMSGNEAFPLAVCKVGSGSNLPGYYMYHGGTNPYNPAHTMAECQNSPVTNYNDMPHMSYDFQAPLGEMGQPNYTAFHQTRWFHQFLADWGEELSQYPVDSLSKNYARRGCFVFRNSYVRILNEDGVASVTPEGMKWQNLTISSASIQPFAKADGKLYFIPVKGAKRYQATINGKKYTFKSGKPLTINGDTLELLSIEKARTAYVLDGKMQYSKHGGILYKGDNGNLTEEYWQYNDGISVNATKTKDAGPLREIKIGAQKVAEQPSDEDFDNAQIYKLDIKGNMTQPENKYLQINYAADCARLYADGKLVEDNFWNGKPMLVRMSDLIDHTTGKQKDIELRILPLAKDAPIYLQAEQRSLLYQAPETGLLSLDGIKVLERVTE